MSRKKRAKEQQGKINSKAVKIKRAKKQYYASYAAKEKWLDKKAKKQQNQITKRVSQGISVDCPLRGWEQPSIEKCGDCNLKCSYVRQ